MSKPPNALRVKALHSPVRSAQEVRPVQEQVEEPKALADPLIPILAPGVITVDKNAAYPKATAQLKAAGRIPAAVELTSWSSTSIIWSSKPIARIKRRVKPAMGFFSMETAGRTLQGYEVMNMIRKGQIHGVAKGAITGQVSFIAHLFAVVASAEQDAILHAHCLR